MTLWLVGAEPLDDGPESRAVPTWCFASSEEARAFAHEQFAGRVGSSHWWGKADRIEACYALWKVDVPVDGARTDVLLVRE